MKLLVLSNVNVSPLRERLSGYQPGHNVDFGDYGDIVRPLVDPSSAAYTDDVDAVVLLLDGPELLGAGDLAREVLAAIERFVTARRDVLLVATTVRADAESSLTYAAATQPGGQLAEELAFNLGLVELAHQTPNVAVLDAGLLFDRLGLERLVSPTFWYAGRIRYATPWFDECARHLTGLLAAYLNQARKVLVCDLDGTLWGGILGEDGPGGILLGEDGAGKCYRDLQREIVTLQNSGVLLAVASKNEPAEVERVVADHPMMLVRPDHVAAWRVGWDDKATSIASLAAELSLGLDSFVFLDDNPVERMLIAEALPEVAVPDVPTRPELLPGWFVRDVAFAYFPKLRILESDRGKTDQYRAQRERAHVQASEFDLASFLERLDIRLTFAVDDELLTERTAQMTQKTNQFNLTVRRFAPHEIADMISDDRYAVVTVRYEDRFGDEGVVGVAILDTQGAEVTAFLLSCRVIGRNVEVALLDEVERLATARGLPALTCTYVRTERNGFVSAFLAEHDWHTSGASGEGAGEGSGDGSGMIFRKDLA